MQSKLRLQLITYDPDDKLAVDAFPLSILPEASRTINCFQVSQL